MRLAFLQCDRLPQDPDNLSRYPDESSDRPGRPVRVPGRVVRPPCLLVYWLLTGLLRKEGGER